MSNKTNSVQYFRSSALSGTITVENALIIHRAMCRRKAVVRLETSPRASVTYVKC
jgi:hypothetical protein